MDFYIASHNIKLNFIYNGRWLKGLNVTIASEMKQRAMAKTIVGENLKAEKGAFTFSQDKGGEVIREAPFVYCPNLIAKVTDSITHHKRQAQKDMRRFMHNDSHVHILF